MSFNKMARVCALLLAAGLLLETHGPGADGFVFTSRQSALAVLHRQKRYNTGILEELTKDNLERECLEETCSMEEAREVFEDDEKTLEFWAKYNDGNQCDVSPCLNGGVCKDGVNSYICYCQRNFAGKNCQIAVQCSVNNGGCSHFCVMQQSRAICYCALGYRLDADMITCLPSEPFSCGIATKQPSVTSIKARSFNTASSGYDTIQLEDYDYNDTLNSSDNISSNSSGAETDPEPDLIHASDSPLLAVESVLRTFSVDPTKNTGEPPLQSWAFFPTLPSITEEIHEDQRIVGGNEATPGEIPWQVTLMTIVMKKPFCGGSLLSELWVITAAHCLTQAKTAPTGFFVRVGEHDLKIDEGTEKDHLVIEQHIHPHYNEVASLYNHDIALLKLSTPVELSDRRRPICLGPKDFTEAILTEASTSLVSGWGRMRYQGLEATRLQKLEVPFVDRTKCKRSSREHVTRFMFCAGYEDKQHDSCQGDSGGPHATRHSGTWFLTGIVSWGEECAKEGKFGVYTRVSRYNYWIGKITGIQLNHPE